MTDVSLSLWMPIAKAGQFSVVVSLYPRMNANKKQWGVVKSFILGQYSLGELAKFGSMF